MPVFKAPQYTKVTNPKTGAQEPCYTFNIEFNICDYLSFVAENQKDISLNSLQKCVLENIPWWNGFIEQFLQASSKYFSKPYTVEQINKITQHTLEGNGSKTFPINVVLVPNSIKICGGVFTVNWNYNTEPMIDFPDVEDVKNNSIELTGLPVSKKNSIVEGLEELNIDEIPVGNNSTDAALELDSPAKFYEKQRVKEARLKAKLAVYKAQRTMAQYYEKYGEDISDSDTDLETSDDDSEEESNDEEEVQL
jgi:hypothetical protein